MKVNSKMALLGKISAKVKETNSISSKQKPVRINTFPTAGEQNQL